MNTTLNNKNGFTLIEILVAMVVSMIVMYMMFSFFHLQQKTYINQSEITATQQDVVGAMHIMEREIRMAGFDTTAKAMAGFSTPASDKFDEINFSADKDDDGNTNGTGESLTYKLSGSDIVRVDASDPALKEEVLISNVDVFNIVYLDTAKKPLTDIADKISDTRSVQVTIVVRVGRADYNFTNSEKYYNQIDLVTPIYTAPGDHFRRRIMKAEILCRNMGLNITEGYGGSVIPAVSL